jgi:prophage regulatory protein
MKFLKLQNVMSITGLSRSSIYLAISEGRFPKQINLGVRSIAFLETEIQEWMESCIANRNNQNI